MKKEFRLKRLRPGKHKKEKLEGKVAKLSRMRIYLFIVL
jgi:hypothetical protein